eukprot:CAMPEP_0182428630 /NCGR_PEP_ID=MMETSP1167-20130531/23160_1 /TAXON_ID=2988 /ORGANISM="Mallomonas Sp, Strain CCMP3275" /LENGTH=271 /DNA_ID=CAMNT_0024611623 /DNA_START=156 /DNA_END=971 /DNA_ORIENTATION=-
MFDRVAKKFSNKSDPNMANMCSQEVSTPSELVSDPYFQSDSNAQHHISSDVVKSNPFTHCISIDVVNFSEPTFVLKQEIDQIDQDNRKHVISFGSTALSPDLKKKRESGLEFQDHDDENTNYCVCVQFEGLKNTTHVTEESLIALLRCFGSISHCSIECSILAENTGLQNGWGVVHFHEPQNAILAAKAMGRINIADISYHCYVISSNQSYNDLELELNSDLNLLQQSSTSSISQTDEFLTCHSSSYPKLDDNEGDHWDSIDEDYPSELQI